MQGRRLGAMENCDFGHVPKKTPHAICMCVYTYYIYIYIHIYMCTYGVCVYVYIIKLNTDARREVKSLDGSFPALPGIGRLSLHGLVRGITQLSQQPQSGETCCVKHAAARPEKTKRLNLTLRSRNPS